MTRLSTRSSHSARLTDQAKRFEPDAWLYAVTRHGPNIQEESFARQIHQHGQYYSTRVLPDGLLQLSPHGRIKHDYLLKRHPPGQQRAAAVTRLQRMAALHLQPELATAPARANRPRLTVVESR